MVLASRPGKAPDVPELLFFRAIHHSIRYVQMTLAFLGYVLPIIL
jgi:hypothetical protein